MIPSLKAKCYICKTVKSLDDFYKNKRRKNGYDTKCKECDRTRDKKHDPVVSRAYKLKVRYKLTIEDYNDLLQSQNYSCVGCERSIEEFDTPLNVDHDHNCCPGEFTCGKCVRGLLCWSCNTAIGKLNHDKQILQNLLKYLK